MACFLLDRTHTFSSLVVLEVHLMLHYGQSPYFMDFNQSIRGMVSLDIQGSLYGSSGLASDAAVPIFGAESFGFFSCIINGEEREQTHRAVFRFVPRHNDELELEVDDPLFVEVQAEDFWYEAFNMRTGYRGIFPAYYAIEVTKEQDPLTATVKSSDWIETFAVKFLGSVQVPYHKGNDVMCAAMQKIANSRRLTLHFNPPSSCILEITIRGVKIVVISDDPRDQSTVNMCSHFFQLKNISFCGYHPKNNKYFGFITKHPADHRFACHVFVSEQSTKALAESVGRAFQLYYKEVMEYTCPTEDIYLE